MSYTLYFDGASRGNPGDAGAGYAIVDDYNQTIREGWTYLGGYFTNNQAEYQALILGLQMALRQGFNELQIMGDAQLVVKQIRGLYDVRNQNLWELYEEAMGLLEGLQWYRIRWVGRHENVQADELANYALDSGSSGER